MPHAVFYIDPTDEVPVYRQLVDQVKVFVAAGTLEPGEELPSTRSLSAELGVNPMTISKAYSLLERDGVLDRRPGLPLVVAQPSLARSREDREDLLADSLEPAVRMARQLDIDRDEATALFRRMLVVDERKHRPSRRLKEE